MVCLLFENEVNEIVGAGMEVYNELDPGFLEPVYQEAMEIETASGGLGLKPQCEIPIRYKGRLLKKYYIADLVDPEKLVVELKAESRLTSRSEGQILNYLKATGLPVGVLINFGSQLKMEWKRFVLTKGHSQESPDELARETPLNFEKDFRED